MPPTSGSVILQAATHLNDPAQLVWTSAKLLPYFNMALQELDGELAANDVTPLELSSITIAVPGGSIVIPQMPTDYIEPVEVYERIAGSTNQWRSVTEVRFVDPNLNVNSEILEWMPRAGSISINPPTTDREVFLRYIRGITAATGTTTPLDVGSSVLYLSLLTARNAASDGGNAPTKAATYEARINRARDRVVRRLQGANQSLGVRRLPYTGRH